MKRKIETSKKIIIAVYVILVAVLVVHYTAVFMMRDASDQIVLAIVALVATANSFYFTKAAIENRLKIKKDNKLSDEEFKTITGGIENEHNSF